MDKLLKAIEENHWDVVNIDFYRRWAVGDDIDMMQDEDERNFVIADTLEEAIEKAIKELT